MKPSSNHPEPANNLLRSAVLRSPDKSLPTSDASLPPHASDNLTSKRILVTGAGGSIGSALVLAIASAAPASLILLDTSEHALYQIDRALNQESLSTPHISILGSICDPDLLAELWNLHQPQIVFHAAAFKHVPLLEHNPFAAIANNVLGTYALLQAATQHHAEHIVLVSTDKAVDPLSIMGASKRIAELLCIALTTSTTRTSAVRLGNILGSQGSVVPLFLDQIAQGGPLTVTHPDARRFFLSIDQCVRALLAALEPHPLCDRDELCKLDKLEELNNGTILLPDLGTPIRIADLARNLIEAHRCSASIVFTQLRPGDKLKECILSSRETRLTPPDGQPRILTPIASPSPSASAIHAAMRALQQSVAARDLSALLRTVLQLVPEYTPSATLLEALQEAMQQSPLALQEAHA